MEYCSLEEFKNYQDITTSDDDSLIEKIISRATAIVDNDLGYNLGKKTYTKRVDGGNNYILLENNSGSIEKIEDKNGFEYTVDFTDGYYTYLENKTPEGNKNIIVTYSKGYEETPEDLKQVFLELVRSLYKSQKSGDDKDVSKKDIDGISITYDTNNADKKERYKKVIQSYKDFSFFY